MENRLIKSIQDIKELPGKEIWSGKEIWFGLKALMCSLGIKTKRESESSNNRPSKHKYKVH